MTKVMIRILLVVTLILGRGVSLAQERDGHFSSWEEVSEIIDSLSVEKLSRETDLLEELTHIQLGNPYGNSDWSEADRESHMLWMRGRWQEWWKSTGEPVSKLKKRDAEVDVDAFQVAWDFLGAKKAPKSIEPVWIPSQWRLQLTFKTGDYMGIEEEVWILDRKANHVRLMKLRGEYGGVGFEGSEKGGGWRVSLWEYAELTQDEADQVLKALCYVNLYAPPHGTEVSDGPFERLYYPNSSLRLSMAKDQILWNLQGYDFYKTRPQYGGAAGGVSGRSYGFLRSIFSDDKKWKNLTEPTPAQLAPYRKVLSESRPYSSRQASEIVQLFGACGHELEQAAMLDWVEKQMDATDPNLGWERCSHDFGTDMKVNVMNSTRHRIQNTFGEIQRIGDRLGRSDDVGEREQKVAVYIEEMLALKAREEDARIQAFPQPLRDLIIVSEHPDDSDLKHRSAAIQAICKDPDPQLFQQMVERLDGGGYQINGLLDAILSGDLAGIEFDPWGEKEEAIAVGACIDAFPETEEKSDLVGMLLRMFGGGKLEFEDGSSSSRIEIEMTENGHSYRSGGAKNPLTIPDAQEELRRLYEEFRKTK